MDPISLLVTLIIICIVAAIFWVIIGVLPLPPEFKRVAMIVGSLILLLWLLLWLLGAVPALPVRV